jgi:hypothetical protein
VVQHHHHERLFTLTAIVHWIAMSYLIVGLGVNVQEPTIPLNLLFWEGYLGIGWRCDTIESNR